MQQNTLKILTGETSYQNDQHQQNFHNQSLPNQISDASKPGLKKSTKSPRGIAIGHPREMITNQASPLSRSLTLINLLRVRFIKKLEILSIDRFTKNVAFL